MASTEMPQEAAVNGAKAMASKNLDDNLNILICTANMGNAEPTLDDMKAWVPAEGSADAVQPLNDQTALPTTPFDMIVVGMQEATWSAVKSRRAKRKLQKQNSGSQANNSQVSDSIISVDSAFEFDDDDDDDDHSHKDGQNDSDPSTDKNNSDNNNNTADLEKKARKDMSQLANLLEQTLGSSYHRLAEFARGQMRLVVFCIATKRKDFDKPVIKAENTGIAHVLANKGGIVLTVNYKETTRLSFISAHLAAHEGDKHYAARCDNLQEIWNGTRHKHYDVSLRSHYTFLLGDLNFRTRFDVPIPQGSAHEIKEAKRKASVEQAFELIEAQDFVTLYDKHDELIQGIANKELLVEFETLPCHFSPTFKVLRHHSDFAYKEQRTPSYCDRILYRAANKALLQPLAYEPCPGFTTSDHKPLRGAFSITPNCVANELQQQAGGDDNILDNDEPTCSYKFTFSKMSCKNLPALDVTGTSDPYIMMRWEFINALATDSLPQKKKKNNWPKTSFVSRTLNPDFGEEEITLSINGMGANGRVPAEALLFITVIDYDMHSQDDLMCTLPMTFQDLVANLDNGGGEGVVDVDQEQEQTINKTQIVLKDTPLLRNGVYYGTIAMTIDIEKSDTPLDIATRKNGGGLLSWLTCGCL